MRDASPASDDAAATADAARARPAGTLAALGGMAIGPAALVGLISLATGNAAILWDATSIAVIVVATLLSTAVSFDRQLVGTALLEGLLRPARQRHGRAALAAFLDRVAAQGRAVRAQGSRSHRGPPDSADPFIPFAFDLLASGYTGAEMRDILLGSVESAAGRGRAEAGVLDFLGSTLAAFGCIASLTAAILMFELLGGAVAQSGAALATPLLPAAFGILSSRLLLAPAAARLRSRADDLRLARYLAVECMALIADGHDPRAVAAALAAAGPGAPRERGAAA
ncbi:MAG: hypothetical protein JNK11_07510 [Alphaproteobacteria bacterium]|nr:hypothetical protein [Alphaproteobacteria bacterium]